MTSLLLPVIYLTFVSLGLPDSLLGSAWPVMYPELGAPVAAQSALSMLISACTIASSLATAKLVRRWGTGRLVAASVGLTAAAILGFSACKEFWQLVALAVPYGLGAGAIDSSLNNYVAIHYGARHMSWLHCCWGVGTSVGPVAMGWALAGPMSWHGGYLVIGVAQALITVVLACSLPLWKNSAGEKDADEAGGAAGGSVEGLGYRELLRLPGAGAVIASFGCYSALESSCGLWIASLLVLGRGVGEAQAASGWYCRAREGARHPMPGIVLAKARLPKDSDSCRPCRRAKTQRLPIQEGCAVPRALRRQSREQDARL